ncbi:MAG: hypothetical protein VW268_08755 [Rhodospirillaceae bacterium]
MASELDMGRAIERPVLDLSGPRLTRSLETLVKATDTEHGIEAYITGLAFKTALFRETLAPDKIKDLEGDTLIGLAAFMGSVRRRIGTWLEGRDMVPVRRAIQALIAGAAVGADTDDRIAAFCDALEDNPKKDRWVRDLAAEILHFTNPEQYPLMCRWVWDKQANTGVLREIWFADDIDNITLDIPDTYATHLMLREELSQFLATNGIFRDMLYYVDLLLAQIYADYINEQGGSFLRTDFSSELDPMQFTRRMLGLDGVDTETGKTRVRLADGTRFVMPDIKTTH